MEENKNQQEKGCAECRNTKTNKDESPAKASWGESIALKAISGIKSEEAKKVDYEGEAAQFIAACEAAEVDPEQAVARVAKEQSIELDGSLCLSEKQTETFRLLKAVLDIVRRRKEEKYAKEERMRNIAQDCVIDLISRFFSDVAADESEDDDGEEEDVEDGESCHSNVRWHRIASKTVYYGE